MRRETKYSTLPCYINLRITVIFQGKDILENTLTVGGGLILQIKDRIILISFTGTISTVVANTFGYLSKVIYKPTVVMPEVSAELFVHQPFIHSFLAIVFGNLWSIIVGGIHAFVFIYVLDFTGWRYIWWKSFIVTNTGWLLGVGLLFRGVNIANRIHSDIISIILFYGAHIVYLSVSALIVSKYGIPLEKQTEIKEPITSNVMILNVEQRLSVWKRIKNSLLK